MQHQLCWISVFGHIKNIKSALWFMYAQTAARLSKVNTADETVIRDSAAHMSSSPALVHMRFI